MKRKLDILKEYLGKEIDSIFKIDANTKQYLMGLEYRNEPSPRWFGKIRYTCNGKVEERWISLEGIKIPKNEHKI